MSGSAKVYITVTLTCMMALTALLSAPVRPIGALDRLNGVWMLWDQQGRHAATLTIRHGMARRHHAYGWCKCQPTDDGALLLAWDDGFRDVFRPTPDGAEFLALPRLAERWDEPARFVLLAQRIGEAR